MADEKYDVIIIGGGNKALITAMYLTKYGGMKVGVFEIRHEAGGGWSSEEVAAPGFVSNTHATLMGPWYHELIWEDFPDFEEKGAELIQPKGGFGMIFEEDHSCGIIYTKKHDPTWELTAKSVAQFSERDAETMLKWGKVWDEFTFPEFNRWLWTPATAGAPDPFVSKILFEGPEHGIDPLWIFKSLMQVLDEVFESIEVKCMFLRETYTMWSGSGDLPATGILFLTMCFAMSREVGFIKGGTHNCAHAAHKIMVENGGKIFPRVGVDRVIIENGKAKGVRLLDGTEVEADIVVSTLSPQLLCSQLIGEEYLPENIRTKMRALSTHIGPSGWWGGWAMRSAPNYKAAQFNPDISTCDWVGLGDKDKWASSKEFWRRMLGKEFPGAPIIEAAPMVWCYSTLDPTIAPEGMHVAGSECYTCASDQFSEKEWARYEKAHAEFLLEKWGKYAPNMTWDNIVGYDITSPFDCFRLPHTPPPGVWNMLDSVPSQMGWVRPIPELSDHRTPIKGLYATGSGWHPFGSGASGGGYTCYRVIAEDFGLRKPWEEKGREY